MPIKVLLADDSDLMRRTIRRFLNDHPEVELVGEAADFAQTVQMTNDLKPQVIVMDLHMAEDSSLDVKSHLGCGASRLLAISISNDKDAWTLAESFGAATLLDKSELFGELIPAIEQLVAPKPLVAATPKAAFPFCSE